MSCRSYAAEAITVITTGAASIAASPAKSVTGGVRGLRRRKEPRVR